MGKNFYEIVFEGHYKIIHGLIEGFLIGKEKEWTYFFSNKAGIQSETLSELIGEWITLRTKLHHVVMEENFYREFKESLKLLKKD